MADELNGFESSLWTWGPGSGQFPRRDETWRLGTEVRGSIPGLDEYVDFDTRYDLLDSIGRGGMATVHRARHRGVGGFDRIVAVKRILPNLATRGEFVERFVREARIVCSLAHSNIVQIYELGSSSAGPYIAMEYLEGWSALRLASAAAAARVEIPLDVVLALLYELCDALDHVHTREDSDGRPLHIVHRDVSLGNLFVDRSGHLKLIDFGIATAEGALADRSPPPDHLEGKPSYMAPETIKRQPGDARADVFAIGVVAWELLAGRKLFTGHNDTQTLSNVLMEQPAPPSTHRADCPPALDALVLAALAKDPRRRTQSAALLRDQLEAMMRDLKTESTSSAVARWIVGSGLFAQPAPPEIAQAAPRTTVDRLAQLSAQIVPPPPPPARRSRERSTGPRATGEQTIVDRPPRSRRDSREAPSRATSPSPDLIATLNERVRPRSSAPPPLRQAHLPVSVQPPAFVQLPASAQPPAFGQLPASAQPLALVPLPAPVAAPIAPAPRSSSWLLALAVAVVAGIGSMLVLVGRNPFASSHAPSSPAPVTELAPVESRDTQPATGDEPHADDASAKPAPARPTKHARPPARVRIAKPAPSVAQPHDAPAAGATPAPAQDSPARDALVTPRSRPTDALATPRSRGTDALATPRPRLTDALATPRSRPTDTSPAAVIATDPL